MQNYIEQVSWKFLFTLKPVALTAKTVVLICILWFWLSFLKLIDN